jgi:phage protein D
MPDALDTGLRSSRPSVLVGGEENGPLGGGLLRLVVVEDTAGLYRCEARFGNWGPVNNTTDFLYFDRRTLDFGKDFQIKSAGKTLFDGKITAIEASFPEGQAAEISVLAEDRFQDLRMTRRTRTFSDVSDSEVFNQIAGDHGLQAGVEVSGPTHKVLAQVNQSDLAFMRERARSIEAELWIESGRLNVKTRANRRGATLELSHGNKLREFKVVADLAGQRTGVTVAGWDVSGKSEVKHEATASVIGGELNGDTSGVEILRTAFGERKESLVHTVPLDSSEAQTEAESYFKMGARRFLTGRGVAETDADLRVGAYVDLQNIGPLFSGKYYVAEVRHLFDNVKGTRTEFRAERPGIGRAR